MLILKFKSVSLADFKLLIFINLHVSGLLRNWRYALWVDLFVVELSISYVLSTSNRTRRRTFCALKESSSLFHIDPGKPKLFSSCCCDI